MKNLLLSLMAAAMCGSAFADNYVRVPVKNIKGSVAITHPATAHLVGGATPTEPDPETGKARITVSTNALSFVQNFGPAPGSQVVTVKNTGDAAGVVSVSTTGFFSAHSSNCGGIVGGGFSVAAGGQCSLAVIFMPQFAAPSHEGMLTVNGPQGATTVALHGDAKLQSYGKLSHSVVSQSGAVVAGALITAPITITNTGNKAVAIGTITASGSGVAIQAAPTTCGKGVYTSLDPGVSCRIQARFSASVDPNVGAINVANDGTNEYGIPVPLVVSLTYAGPVYERAGIFLNAGAGTAEVPVVGTISMGYVAYTSGYTAMFRNSGNVPVQVGAATVSGANVRVDQESCTTVPAGGSCSIRLYVDKLPVGEHHFMVSLPNDGVTGVTNHYQTVTVTP